METRDLDYLLAVEEHGGIGKAAEALGMSQPALTKAIQRVEAQTGLALFQRTANGVTPTQAGSLFLARARRIALEYEDALKEMHAIRSGEQGVLSLGYSPTVPAALVLGACRQLLKERPAARLRLRRRLARDLVDLLVAGELDLIVAPEPKADADGLSFVELFRDNLSVLADESHPLHLKRNLRLADLADQEWLLPGPTIPVRQQVDAAFARLGLDVPRLRVETDFGSTSLLHLLRGTAMLCVAGTESFDALEGLRALNVDTSELDLRRHIGVVFRKDAYLSPLAQRAIALLQEWTN
ncbi:LysR family transcriptional regulator [Paraburkholderia ginsengiterrae]|uniref:LysR family transcriptional regulator n=1 Tax=Paraburkholderia ginsengiterrae TaxID=1462993 RepID=A0A1A9N9U9_9BURK|nr:LysR family transcriptional regulator [Paraburkholderia ginsengiterrae]OAJ57106.1 LysR family transcriptional regulator [Paraburkholderia ginsengiterrae]OAJ61330.1 LysR family transcriptional regulator [Paraburkholderia ginsengiterrae]